LTSSTVVSTRVTYEDVHVLYGILTIQY